MSTEFAKIPKSQTFKGKRYTLKDSFVSKETANSLKSRYKKQGYLVRIVQRGGVVHFLKRFHVYVRKG